MSRTRFVATLVCSSVGLCAPAAKAHISLERAGTHKSRYGENEIKSAPCGRAAGKRGTNVYTYEPGQVIDVAISEYIAHPGYFRIAFDNDGDDGFESPARIPGAPPSGRPCMGPGDKCGEPDYYNNETVLDGMDNLDPHASGENNKIWQWKVELPDVECDNCTLQIIQLMAEGGRAPYDPDGTNGSDDIYFQCIDLVLKRGASGAAGKSGTAGADQPAAMDPADAAAGCSMSSARSSDLGPLTLLAGALALLLRRRAAPRP